jgi:hypothetical protein
VGSGRSGAAHLTVGDPQEGAEGQCWRESRSGSHRPPIVDLCWRLIVVSKFV